MLVHRAGDDGCHPQTLDGASTHDGKAQDYSLFTKFLLLRLGNVKICQRTRVIIWVFVPRVPLIVAQNNGGTVCDSPVSE